MSKQPQRTSQSPDNPFIKWLSWILLTAIVALAGYFSLSAAWPDLNEIQENDLNHSIPLVQSTTVQQTIHVTYDGLNSIQFYGQVDSQSLEPNDALIFRLSKIGSPEITLIEQHTPISTWTGKKAFRIHFPAIPDSGNQDYLLSLESNTPQGTLTLYASQEDAYPKGHLVLNGISQQNDLAFRLYDTVTPLKIFSTFSQLLPFFNGLLLAVGLYLLAGTIITILIGAWPTQTWDQRILFALICGLVFPPILYFLASLINVSLSPARVVGITGILSFAAAIRLFFYLRSHPIPLERIKIYISGLLHTVLPLISLILLAALTRTLQLRDIYAPLWTDGLQHAEYAMQIIQNQGLPSGVIYHLGFHSQVAVLFPWLGLSLEQVLLVNGQLVNIAIGLSLILLGQAIYGRRFPAWVGACFFLLFARMPAYLVNWSRFPFQLGLTLGLACLALLVQFIQTPRRTDLFLFLLLFAGMVLSHYGSVVFVASLFLTLLLSSKIRNKLSQPLISRLKARPILAIMAAPVILLILISLGALILNSEKIAAIILDSRRTAAALDLTDMLHITLSSSGLAILGMAILGFGLSWLKKQPQFWVVPAWIPVHFALVTLQEPLLGQAIASYANSILALSIPLSLLAGIGLDCLFELPLTVSQPNKTNPKFKNKTKHRFRQPLYLITLCLVGSLSLVGIINPAANRFTPADEKAIEWIRLNTPPDARFWINTQPWGAEIVPADGGGWIPVKTGRETIHPQNSDEYNNIVGLFKANQPEFIYSGVGDRAAEKLIDPSYGLIYEEAGIKLFQLKR